MKISFDFDQTLSQPRIQKVAKKFIDAGNEVWITTARPNDIAFPVPIWNRDLIKVANKLGIPFKRVQYTAGQDKYLFLDGFDLHFDNDKPTIELIDKHLPSCSTILVVEDGK